MIVSVSIYIGLISLRHVDKLWQYEDKTLTYFSTVCNKNINFVPKNIMLELTNTTRDISILHQ